MTSHNAVTNKSDIKRFYEALLSRDPSFLGSFYVGVKTTSIFCISTCRARKPKLANVVFFKQLKDALNNGFRACKICRPSEQLIQTPNFVIKAIRLAEEAPKNKVKDYHLRKNGIPPEKLRRWFKKEYGITFQQYQRMSRINVAIHELKAGKSITESAFDCGYDSLSGFGYTYKKVIGQAPSQTNNQTILLSRYISPLGPMFICAVETGVCLVEFVDRRMLESEFKLLQTKLKATIIIGENKHIKQAIEQLDQYFSGQRKEFDLALVTPGSEFQNAVWLELQNIAYGETRTYSEQAVNLGNPKAIRAVASANGNNKIAIIIPCHRVIGKNGSLTGYGGGLERKRWLLEHGAPN